MDVEKQGTGGVILSVLLALMQFGRVPRPGGSTVLKLKLNEEGTEAINKSRVSVFKMGTAGMERSANFRMIRLSNVMEEADGHPQITEAEGAETERAVLDEETGVRIKDSLRRRSVSWPR